MGGSQSPGELLGWAPLERLEGRACPGGAALGWRRPCMGTPELGPPTDGALLGLALGPARALWSAWTAGQTHSHGSSSSRDAAALPVSGWRWPPRTHPHGRDSRHLCGPPADHSSRLLSKRRWGKLKPPPPSSLCSRRVEQGISESILAPKSAGRQARAGTLPCPREHSVAQKNGAKWEMKANVPYEAAVGSQGGL